MAGMTCRVALCAVCRMAGLTGCPERGAPLPLAEAEKPKVVFSGRVWAPQTGTITYSKPFNRWKW